MSVNEKMTAIADKIRSYTQETDKLSLDKMPAEIERCHDIGFEDGVKKGETDGRQAQYDEFWENFLTDTILGNGYSSKYLFAGKGWNDNVFNPSKSLKPISAESFFRECLIVNLAEILEKNGVTFDFSKNVYFDNFAYSSTIKHFPEISLESAGYWSNMFAQCTNLETIDKLILKSAGNQALTNAFTNCTKLANIVIEGVIGRNFNISQSPLTKESITSIVNALSSTETGRTLSLKTSAVNTAFETSEGAADGSTSEEWATLIATKTNWTISLV